MSQSVVLVTLFRTYYLYQDNVSVLPSVVSSFFKSLLFLCTVLVPGKSTLVQETLDSVRVKGTPLTLYTFFSKFFTGCGPGVGVY